MAGVLGGKGDTKRRLALLLGSCALIASVAIPASAHNRHHRSTCGKTHHGWTTIFDGSKRCLEKWRYAGGASMTRQRDGTLRSGPGAPGLGVLWYAARPYGDFTLKLRFRDDAPESGQRANSGVQVRFPAPRPPVPGCPTTFNGQEQNNAGWIAVNCGHEIQINDSPDGPPFDPRKTGSIYGFADIDSAQSHPTGKGVWNDLEITVVGQHYTAGRTTSCRSATSRSRTCPTATSSHYGNVSRSHAMAAGTCAGSMWCPASDSW